MQGWVAFLLPVVRTQQGVRYGKRNNGHNRLAGEEERLRLPVERDLWRLLVHLRLRTLGRGAEAQRQEPMVARHGAVARRYRGPRLGYPHVAAHLAGLWPPDRVRRPSSGLQGMSPSFSSG